MSDSAEEALKDLLDPVTFSQRFIRIETPDGLVPWRLDGYQKKFLRDNSRQRIVNKSKKVGISTALAADGIHKGFTTKGLQLIFVATGQRFARELLGKIYDEIDSMPPGLQPRFKSKSTEEASFMNGSRLISLPSSEPDRIRGFGLRGTRTDVYIDEHAHVPNDKDLWTVIRDFARLGGRISSISTPKGKRGIFYKIAEPLQSAYRGLTPPPTDQSWSYHEIPWWRCPRHRAAGEKSLRENSDDITFLQEYNCMFIDESVSFFPFEVIWKAQKIADFVESGYKTNNPITIGVDFGKSVSETILYVVEETSPEHYKTLYVEVLPGVDYTTQVEMITQLDRVFKPTLINVDGTGPGGQTIVDFLKKEECGYKINSYNLMSSFKEKIVIRLRMLMDHGRFAIPTRECPYGDKMEMQLHSIQRSTTISGEHTRYSGKETGMDDMVWAMALAVYKEFETQFDPIFTQWKDEALRKLTKGDDQPGGILVREWRGNP